MDNLNTIDSFEFEPSSINQIDIKITDELAKLSTSRNDSSKMLPDYDVFDSIKDKFNDQFLGSLKDLKFDEIDQEMTTSSKSLNILFDVLNDSDLSPIEIEQPIDIKEVFDNDKEKDLNMIQYIPQELSKFGNENNNSIDEMPSSQIKNAANNELNDPSVVQISLPQKLQGSSVCKRHLAITPKPKSAKIIEIIPVNPSYHRKSYTEMRKEPHKELIRKLPVLIQHPKKSLVRKQPVLSLGCRNSLESLQPVISSEHPNITLLSPSNPPCSSNTKNILQESVQYTDFSEISDEEACERFNVKYSSMRGRTQDTFQVKLHSILERSKKDGYSSIISWVEHGRAFKIHDHKEFFDKILRRFFYQSKMSSFMRQLAMYDFHKIVGKKNPDKGCFYHELFLRGRPGLCKSMARQGKRRRIIRPEAEPNLSRMKHMPYFSSFRDDSDLSSNNSNSLIMKEIRYTSTSNSTPSVEDPFFFQYEKLQSKNDSLSILKKNVPKLPKICHAPSACMQ